MAKKRKKGQSNSTVQSAPDAKNFSFELTPPQPIFREDGTRDYYNEYYRAYKNDYIDQYLRAYREFHDLNAAIEHVDNNSQPKK